MKVSNVKGLANRDDPESCVEWSNPRGEALTGESAGWVLSREIPNARDADPVGEGHNQCFALARSIGIPRGQRPQACTEATCARTGRSCVQPSRHGGDASRTLTRYGDDERTQEVGQTRSSDEAREQSWRDGEQYRCVDGGASGAKGSGQREAAAAKHEPGTGPERRAKCAGADTASSRER